MAQRNIYDGLLLPGFVIDQESIVLSYGRQIDWTAAGVDELAPGTVVSEVAPGGKVIPRTATGATAAFGILLTGASKNAPSDALTGYGIARGGGFYRNMMPAMTAAVVTELGARFYFEDYLNTAGA